MKKTSLIMALLGAVLIIAGAFRAAGDTEISIQGIRSEKGSILINVFKSQQAYEDQKPDKKFTFNKSSLFDGSITVRLKLEDGMYGVTLVDDENGNGKIDKNMIGIPKEGFGFSNFFMEKLKRPAFKEFKITVPSSKPVTIKVKYM